MILATIQNPTPEKVKEALAEYSGALTVYICNAERPRTLDQNNYYWGVVLGIISASTGHHKDELHKIYKNMFNMQAYVISDPENKDRGVLVEAAKSTSSVSAREFTEYINRIVIHAGQHLGLYIPPPQGVTDANLLDK